MSDNNPLTYVLTTANLDATGHRWLAALGAFDFEIAYRPGKNNADADSLSRLVYLPNPNHYVSVNSYQFLFLEIPIHLVKQTWSQLVAF
jgi:hypothetical protein